MEDIRINMDTICENVTPDTSIELFGEKFDYQFFAGPVGAMKLHYGDKYDDLTYNDILVSACMRQMELQHLQEMVQIQMYLRSGNSDVKKNHGQGIPTVRNARNIRQSVKEDGYGRIVGKWLYVDIDDRDFHFLRILIHRRKTVN